MYSKGKTNKNTISIWGYFGVIRRLWVRVPSSAPLIFMKTKKQIRHQFRTLVFTRDSNRCRICNAEGKLDAHHITNRNEIPNGGYVLENGISLCEKCHLNAEKGIPSSEELYKLVGSSLEEAIKKSEEMRL